MLDFVFWTRLIARLPPHAVPFPDNSLNRDGLLHAAIKEDGMNPTFSRWHIYAAATNNPNRDLNLTESSRCSDRYEDPRSVPVKPSDCRTELFGSSKN